MLATSERIREVFKEEEIADCVGVLENMLYAPQRFASQARPSLRMPRRFRQLFSMLSVEADEGKSQVRRKNATALIEQLSEEETGRLLLAGLLCDLKVLLYEFLVKSDYDNPESCEMDVWVRELMEKTYVMFDKGGVFRKDMRHTCTGQVLDFLAEPKILFFKQRQRAFELPAATDPEFWVPLNRIRNVCKNIPEYLKIYRPDSDWHYKFSCFRLLPTPLKCVVAPQDRGKPHFARAVEAENSLREIMQADGEIEDVDKTLSQVRALIPYAEAHRKEGVHTDECWARASREFAEYKGARAAVDLLLMAPFGTGRAERQLKEIPFYISAYRASLLSSSVADHIMANQAPPVEAIAEETSTDAIVAKNGYMQEVCRLHTELWGKQRCTTYKKRRDHGVARDTELTKRRRVELGLLETEVCFIRERHSEIEKLVELQRQGSGPTIDCSSASRLGVQPQYADDAALEQFRTEAMKASLEKARKRFENSQKLRADRATGQPVAPEAGSDKKVRWGDRVERAKLRQAARRLAGVHGSTPKVDPFEFLEECAKERANKTHHLVVSPSLLCKGDGRVPILLALLTGAFLCDRASFAARRPKGLQHKDSMWTRKRTIAMTVAFRQTHSEVPGLLIKASNVPGSLLQVVRLEGLAKDCPMTPVMYIPHHGGCGSNRHLVIMEAAVQTATSSSWRLRFKPPPLHHGGGG